MKIIAVAACGLILSYGLCQLGFYQGRNVHDGAPNTTGTIGGLGLVLFTITLIVGGVIAALEAAIDISEKRRR